MKFFCLSKSLIVLAIANIFNCQEATPPQVPVEDGILEGVHRTSRDGLTYFAFLGIPYAKSPTRFQLAEPPVPWTVVKEVKEFGEICAQLAGDTLIGSEDCLFLNVFSPAKDNETLPVMFYIPGGAFKAGGSNEYGESFLMDEAVVLVTINYRLGALGFLDTGDGHVEGNLALKDSLLALQWVNKNIHAFGGDATQITISGGSAGSMMVHAHLMSPLTAELFKYAILMSGSSLSHLGLVENPGKAATALGNKFNCSSETSAALVQCLSSQNAEDIVKNQEFAEWFIDPIVAFGITVDHPSSEQIFLPDKPINLLTSGKFNRVPTMFTITEDEGITMHSALISRTEELHKELNKDYLRIFPITLGYNDHGYTEEKKNEISKSIREFFFGENEIGPDTFQNLTNMYSDRIFATSVEKSINLQAKYHQIFAGIFSYKGDQSYTKRFGIDEVLVTHGDDTIYMFDQEFFKIPSGHRDEVASKFLIPLYTNFAKYGNPRFSWGGSPNEQWNHVNPAELQDSGKLTWAKIDINPSLVDNPFKERFKFWESVFLEPGPQTPT